MNQVNLTGRLASKPMSFDNKDYTRASIVLAVNGTKKEDVNFVRVYFKGQTADYVLSLDKGDIVSVLGHLNVATMTDKSYRLNVYGDKVTFVSRKAKTQKVKEA